jgi:hypothetical protein
MSALVSDAVTRSEGRKILRLKLIAVAVGWLTASLICGSVELSRLIEAAGSAAGILGWFANWNLDTTLSFLVFVSLPIIIASAGWQTSWSEIRKRYRSAIIADSSRQAATIRSRRQQAAVAGGLFLLSFVCSASIGMRSVDLNAASGNDPRVISFSQLPPAYHDEFSYLLQAQTFLAGRVAWPAMAVHPDLFHQVHVLNEPRTASRYFPWTGFWMAPFVHFGYPYVGHWTAGALSCVCFYGSMLRFMQFRWALFGGLLIAVSPGLAVFSNLLLAHHPTMLVLSVFLWSFLRLMDSGATRDAAISGTALTCAMLGRPMTAAGFALPFGLWLLFQIVQSCRLRGTTSQSPVFRVRLIAATGLPLIGGFLILAEMNREITGEWTRSAYQYYTDTWTPRHRFGFNNAEIGAKRAGREVLSAYDRWATNLTVEKSLQNVGNRIIASFQWTLGIGALAFGLIAALPSCVPRGKNELRISLVLCSVISLHAVHIPYWFDGILHWHYVFETAPLLLILATVGLKNAADSLKPLGIPRSMACWLFAVVAASLLPSWLTAETFWGPSRMSLAVSEQTFSRARFEQFRRLTHSSSVHQPSLILVDETSSDPQLSYIINPPDLVSDVLVCRLPSKTSDLVELQQAFPDRTLYRFGPATFQLSDDVLKK